VSFSIDDLASKREPEPWDGESLLDFNRVWRDYLADYDSGIRAYAGSYNQFSPICDDDWCFFQL